MKIDHHIAKLLYDYDCVVVPQLGGFVTNYRPARIDERNGIAHPAQKDIGFNRNLMRSDGLLEQAIQEAEGYSFEEASSELRAIVAQYWKNLQNGETLNLQKVGVLFLDNYRNLRFEPSQEVNFLTSSFGFEAFKMPERLALHAGQPVAKGKVVPMKPAIVNLETAETPYRQSRTMYWVAAATLLPFIGMSLYMAWSTDLKSPTNLSAADLLPFRNTAKVAPKYEPIPHKSTIDSTLNTVATWPEGVTVFPYSFEMEAVDSTGVWINLEAQKLAIAEAVKLVQAEGIESQKVYHLIAGCFGEEANAQKFVQELIDLGHGADIIDLHKGLYRVSMQSYADYQTALDGLGALRNTQRFSEIWMLKKPI